MGLGSEVRGSLREGGLRHLGEPLGTPTPGSIAES